MGNLSNVNSPKKKEGGLLHTAGNSGGVGVRQVGPDKGVEMRSSLLWRLRNRVRHSTDSYGLCYSVDVQRTRGTLEARQFNAA